MYLIRKKGPMYKRNIKVLKENNIGNVALFQKFLEDKGLDLQENFITQVLIDEYCSYMKNYHKNPQTEEVKSSKWTLKDVFTKEAWNETNYRNKQLLKKEGLVNKLDLMDMGFLNYLVKKGMNIGRDEITVDLINEYREYNRAIELYSKDYIICEKRIKELCGGFSYNKNFKERALKYKSIDGLNNVNEKDVLKHECRIGALKVDDIESRLDELLQLDCETLNKIKYNVNTSNFKTQSDIDEFMNGANKNKDKNQEHEINPLFNRYIIQCNELKSIFSIKEEHARLLIEKSFPSPQMTNVKFNSIVDECSKVFNRRVDIIMSIIDSSTECSKRIDEEIQYHISVLKGISGKLDSLSDELLINLSKTENEEVKNVLDELNQLTDSIKDY